MDTGPLVAVDRTPLAGDEDAPAVEARLAQRAGDLLARAIGPYLRGELPPRSRSPSTGSRSRGRSPARTGASTRRRRRPSWSGGSVPCGPGPARSSTFPAAASRCCARPWGRGAGADEAGTVVADGRGIALATPTGRLRLVEVRPAGGRAMDGAAYRRGHPAVVGARVAWDPR